MTEERTCETCYMNACDGECENCRAYQPDKQPTCCCIVHKGNAKECPWWTNKDVMRFAKLLMNSTTYGMHSTKTNREWLESLPLKELTKFLSSSLSTDIVYSCKNCPYYNDKSDEYNDCDRCIEYWLRQEHKDEQN